MLFAKLINNNSNSDSLYVEETVLNKHFNYNSFYQ